jgi:hypothetical protein
MIRLANVASLLLSVENDDSRRFTFEDKGYEVSATMVANGR